VQKLESGAAMLRGATCGGIVPVTESLDGLSRIAEQVPGIGDLDGVWGALTNAVGVGAGTIAGDDLDPRTITQPDRDGGGLAIGQEIDHFVRFEVHQHRAVVATTSPPLYWLSNGYAVGTFASSAHSSMPSTRGAATFSVERRAGARRSRVSGLVGADIGEARSGFTAEHEAEVVLEISQSSGPAAKKARYFRQALRECPSSAVAQRREYAYRTIRGINRPLTRGSKARYQIVVNEE